MKKIIIYGLLGVFICSCVAKNDGASATTAPYDNVTTTYVGYFARNDHIETSINNAQGASSTNTATLSIF